MDISNILKVQNYKQYTVDFGNKNWHVDIPAESGWYFIETNAPIKFLQALGEPHEKNNYNIPEKIKANQCLLDLGFAINQKGNDFYIVYSGHAKNLKSRAREHSFGGKGTGCLALNKYIFKNYQWTFHYYLLKEADNRNLRVYGEQLFRSKHEWPILCSN